MSVKEDWPRPYSTTKEERDLRDKYATTKMTFDQYERKYKKLLKQGLIKRNGSFYNPCNRSVANCSDRFTCVANVRGTQNPRIDARYRTGNERV